MNLAGLSVTQLIVFILSFWQPSVIPDVISLTTWKKFLLKRGGWEGRGVERERERDKLFSCIWYVFKAMMILRRQC